MVGHRGSFSELSIALDDLISKTVNSAGTFGMYAFSKNDKELYHETARQCFSSVNKVFDVMTCRFGNKKLYRNELIGYDKKIDVVEGSLKNYGVNIENE